MFTLVPNQQLLDSFIDISWSYSDLEKYELEDMKSPPTTNLTLHRYFLLSRITISADGLRVLVQFLLCYLI